jgi:hypothetical protein
MQLFKNLFYLGILRDWFQFVVRLFRPVVDTFTPPKPFSWQTLFWLSVFSAVVSLLIESLLISSFVGQVGWLFLTLSIIWATQNLKFSFLGWTFRPGSWIGGAFVAWLLYFWNHTSFAFALTVWPIISALISTIPRFLDLDRGQVFKVPNVAYRQQLVTIYLTAMIASCWFGFHFLVQEWLARYPSLALDDLHHSAFVVKVGQPFAQELPANSVGVSGLALAEQRLTQQLAGQPWTETERWLIAQGQNQFEDFQEQVQSSVQLQQQRAASARANQPVFWKRSPSDAPVQEYRFWSLMMPQVTNPTPENAYVMTLTAVWTGPSSDSRGYQLSKRCAIAEVPPGPLLPSPRDLLPDRLPTARELLQGELPDNLLPNPEDLLPNTSPQARVSTTSVTCEPTRSSIQARARA